jgi:hypothetical protein
VVVSAGCGSRHAAPPTTTTVTVFRLENGLLHAERAEVPAAYSTPAAALSALGLHLPVTVADGTAHVSIGTLAPGRVAEVVYTLTALPRIRRVDVGGRHALDRADVVAYAPLIFVERPADGASVARTFTVSGTASVFEATLVVELRRSGTTLERKTVTASEGAPERGTFATKLHAPAAGPVTVVAFAPSAADGSPQHLQRVSVTVRG